MNKAFVPLTFFTLFACVVAPLVFGGETDEEYIRQHYTKYEYSIPMRDGVKLFTAVYVPNDKTETYPFILFRTPYSISPYGADEYRAPLGPNMGYAREGYIFVFQDVRGRFMSEGTFVNMTPHVDDKKGKIELDESTDTYDTIDWLLANIEGHNGNVGQWGISYPGFYTAAGYDRFPSCSQGRISSSPNRRLVWDDFHHHGALFLPHAFNFLSVFGKAREGLTTDWPPRFQPSDSRRLPILPGARPALKRQYALFQERDRLLEQDHRAPQLRRVLAEAKYPAPPEEHQMCRHDGRWMVRCRRPLRPAPHLP